MSFYPLFAGHTWGFESHLATKPNNMSPTWLLASGIPCSYSCFLASACYLGMGNIETTALECRSPSLASIAAPEGCAAGYRRTARSCTMVPRTPWSASPTSQRQAVGSHVSLAQHFFPNVAKGSCFLSSGSGGGELFVDRFCISTLSSHRRAAYGESEKR